MGTWLSCAKNGKNKKGKTLFHTHDIIGTTNVPLDLHRGVSSRILEGLDVSWNDNRSKGYCVYLHTIHPTKVNYGGIVRALRPPIVSNERTFDNFTRSTLGSNRIVREKCALDRWKGLKREWNAMPYTIYVCSIIENANSTNNKLSKTRK